MQRIFQASTRGDVKAVRKLQKLLIRSRSAKLLAVRKVTQDNQGKKTAGVDGVKSLSPEARMNLANNLKITNRVRPTRRVMIPKPHSDELRPLGIPTIRDRALQTLVKSVLEPEWEAKFEPNSYGFRPGRSCHDAIEAVFKSINQKAKYVLDADIKKCYDRINHEALLKKINTYPTLNHLIKQWLKAGYVEGDNLFPTNEGTPQGGSISPLLANIALHGMENRIKEFARTLKSNKVSNEKALKLVRYADDFVILHEDINVIKSCKVIIEEWLSDMGLELKPEKTKIAHTLIKLEKKTGFDFLGFHIQQHKVGNYRSSKRKGKIPVGFNTLITPSNKCVKAHLRHIGRVIDSHKAAPQSALISKLNPIIKGWANYYSSAVSKAVFNKLDALVYDKLRAWARHRGKGNINKDKYWKIVGSRNWCFSTENGLLLKTYSDTPIVRFIKVLGDSSPYNGDWSYWSKRKGNYPGTPSDISKLLKKQKGICPHCGLFILDSDTVEVDHCEIQTTVRTYSLLPFN